MRFLLTFFSLLFSSLVLANSLNNIVIFGDSLSDDGNLYEYMHHKLPQSPPYFEGRFTNGLTWVEYLAASYFPHNTRQHLFNYAFGGAAVLENEEEGVLFTLQREINSYLLANQDRVNEDSLFVIWIGANNYLNSNAVNDQEKNLMQVNRGLTQSLQRLAIAGAKNILILNLPDLGATPYARMSGLQDQMSYLAKRHNELLQGSIDRLKSLHPEVQWLYFDAQNTLRGLFASPEAYGFKNVTDTCYETEVTKSRPFSPLRMVAGIKASDQQKSCDDYLFFDPIHPTAPAHRLVAEQARNFLDAAGIKFVS